MTNLNRIQTLLWEVYANFYDALFELLPYRQLMQSAVEAIRGDNGLASVLDAGCGTGNLAVSLTRAGRQGGLVIEAIDASPAMLRKAQKKLQNQPGVKFRAMDLNAPLLYDNESFDNVVSIHSLYATRDPCYVLNEFYRKLKFGGRLIIANPKRNPKMISVLLAHVRMWSAEKGLKKLSILLHNILRLPHFILIVALNGLIVKLGGRNTYHFYDLDELMDLLIECNFTIMETSCLYGETDIFVVAVK